MISSMKKDGLFILRQKISFSEVEKLKVIFDNEVTKGGEGRGFLREKKNIAQNNDIIRTIYSSLSEILTSLAGHNLLFTQCLGVEIAAGFPGFGWHVDLGSFNFISAKTHAYSLWIPLDPISYETTGQGGGISYLPLHIARADEYFCSVEEHFLSSSWQKISNEPKIPSLEKFFKNEIIDSFELGDSLFFSKYLWHRSIEFKEGIIPTRRAIILRFVHSDSRFAKLFHDRYINAASEKSKARHSYGKQLSDELEEGAFLSDSKFTFLVSAR